MIGLRNLVKYIYLFLIFISIVLPTGSYNGVPFKLILSFILVISVFFLMANYGIEKMLLYKIFIYSSFGIFFFVYGAFSFQGFVYASKELSLFLSMIFMIILGKYLLDVSLINNKQILNAIITGSLIYSAIKMIYIAFIYMGVISYNQLLEYYENTFNYSFISQGLGEGLIRFNIIGSDIILLISISAIIFRYIVIDNIVLTVLFNIIIFSGLVLAHSRLLYIGIFILFVVYYLLHFNLNAMMKLILIFTIVAGFVYMFFYGWGLILIETIFERFYSNYSIASDLERGVMIKGIIDVFANSPFVGYGFGAYDYNNIRDLSTPFTYEVQLVAFLLKFGLIGTSLLLSVLAVESIGLSKIKNLYINKDQFIRLILFVFLVFASLSNQYLMNSVCGIFIIGIYSMRSNKIP